MLKITPVVDSMPADLLTPLAVYLKLAAIGSHSFLLESVEGGESLARFSFVGVEPDLVVSGNDRAVTVRHGNTSDLHAKPMFQFLRDTLEPFEIEGLDDMPPFVGGAIGYIGFDCSTWFEPAHRRSESADGKSVFMFFSSVIAFDHVKQTIKLISIPLPNRRDGDPIERARARNARVRKTLENSSLQLPDQVEPAADTTVRSNWTRDEFENAVRAIKELILAGECYQVVLSQCFSRVTAADPVSIYRAVRSINPSPYMFLLKLGGLSLIGASPEMLVKCTGRHLEYRPIAGTRPRGETSKEDSKLADEMRHDEKEVAEHLMLVDLGRNDLGRVAEYGTVKVDKLMSVEKYSHVQHLVTNLSAQLRPELDRFDALEACFPAGTVSGAPKTRAIEIIRSLEREERGVYAGAVGYFGYGGNMDTCIAIRTMVLTDGVARVQAGAGIVADSIPELEYEETINKASALLRAIELAEGRTV